MKSLLALLLICSFSFSQNEKKIEFKKTIDKKLDLKYILSSPNDEKSIKPLIVFLHGSGERGSDLEKVKIHGPLKYIKTNKLDSYILAPQCPEGKVWDNEELYYLILDVLKNNPSIDKNRIYLTGMSMGAWGAWNLAEKYPNLFAALVPICGMTDRIPLFGAENIKNIPIRIFHGVLDDVVPMSESVDIYKKLLKVQAKDVHLTLFDDANHDSWTRVYDDSKIYKWMLEQKK